MIETVTYPAASLTASRAEALRYLRTRGEPDARTAALLEEAFAEAADAAVCRCRFGVFPTPSPVEIPSALARRHLAGCPRLVLFGATLGSEVDRRIARAAQLSPARAAVLDAAAGALVEALVERLSADLALRFSPHVLKTRFSPGYGDLPLAAQRRICEVLSLARIGVGLNDSLLLSPAKTVTAAAGLAPADT